MDRTQMDTPGTDEWFVARLSREIAKRRKFVAEMQKWMNGEPDVPHPDNEKPGFTRLQELARVNLAQLIVESRLHRLKVLGAQTKMDDSPNGDDYVNSLFLRHDLSSKFQQVFRHALMARTGYMIVTDSGVRVSSSDETAVERDVSGDVVAAVTVYRDDLNNRDVMILARPGYVRYAYKHGASLLPSSSHLWTMVPDSWELEEQQEREMTAVDVYEFSTSDGKSLIEKNLPTLERINHGVLQRLILIAMQAFRQRALKGLPSKDEKGTPIDYTGAFESAPDSLWALPAGVDVWESGQAEFSGVLNGIKDDIRVLAVQSKTPLYIISPDDANGSATGAETQRETFEFDIQALIESLSGPVRAVIVALLNQEQQSDRADLDALKLIWAPSRRSSLTERAQAALTAKNAGIPFRMVMEKFAELTPEEVADALQQRSDDVLMAAIAGKPEDQTQDAGEGNTSGGEDTPAE